MSERELHNLALTYDDLDDMERRSAEYRRFLSCGGQLPIRADDLSDESRLAIIDVPRLVMAMRANDPKLSHADGRVAPPAR